MFFPAFLCLAAALYYFTKALPLSDEKRREGRLFAEDEEKLRVCRRRICLFSGLSLLFTFCALSGGLL